MPTTRPELPGTSGTAASTDRPTGGVERSVLERGGDAVHAAGAAALLRAAADARLVQGCAVGR